MYNLQKIPPIIKKREILKMLASYQIPPFPQDNIQVLKNINTKNIKDLTKIKYAITLNKSIIKSHPTNKVYKKSSTDCFNRLYQTALAINSNILVIHQSLDQKWYFIICEFYYGWIESKYVLFVNKELFLRNLNKKKYLTIIEPFITYKNYIIDMGTTFYYTEEKNKTYLLLLTFTGYEKVPLLNNQFVYQTMLLTKKNVIKIAYKYLNTPYNLGDDLYKIDCSSFIGNILKVFNIHIPRDTKDIIKYLNISHSLKRNGHYIQLLHFNGHIALYLYSKNNKDYYIHANAKNMQVTIDYLGNHYLNYQDIIGISTINNCQNKK